MIIYGIDTQLTSRRGWKRVATCCVGWAFCLLPVILELFWPLPTTDIFPANQQIAGHAFASTRAITSWSDPRIARTPNESLLEFANRAAKEIHFATYFCEYSIVEQNWWAALVARLGFIDVSQGLLTPVAMRCGFCHQRNFILVKALRQAGIEDALLLGLNGHVTATFTYEGKQYAIDADQGVSAFEFANDGKTSEQNIFSWYETEDPDLLPSYHEKIAKAYASTTDNAPYYSYATMEALSDAQSKVLEWRYPVDGMIFFVGIAALTTCCLHRPKRHETPYAK